MKRLLDATSWCRRCRSTQKWPGGDRHDTGAAESQWPVCRGERICRFLSSHFPGVPLAWSRGGTRYVVSRSSPDMGKGGDRGVVRYLLLLFLLWALDQTIKEMGGATSS